MFFEIYNKEAHLIELTRRFVNSADVIIDKDIEEFDSCYGMAGAAGIIKDVRELYSSIFDHKPIVQREVDFFVKEFEESRKDREVDRLFKILERVTELKETELSKTQALGDIHLPKLAAELQVAESIANKLNHKRAIADREVLSKLEKRREERVAEWDTFVHDMTTKCIRIDSNYKEKQDEIREVYKKAEEKLLNKETGSSSSLGTNP